MQGKFLNVYKLAGGDFHVDLSYRYTVCALHNSLRERKIERSEREREIGCHRICVIVIVTIITIVVVIFMNTLLQ